MISVIILDGGEPSVVDLTFRNLFKELKDIPDSELLIKRDWFDLEGIKNRYVCFVEPDCLVAEGYFKKQLEGFKKRGYSRLTGVMSSTTAVTYWDNKIYGYQVGSGQGTMPNRKKKSSSPFTVQVAYIPGAILRMTMLQTCLGDIQIDLKNDLVYLSQELSIAFWKRGYRVICNPQTTYCTTEDYVNDIGVFPVALDDKLISQFSRESI